MSLTDQLIVLLKQEFGAAFEDIRADLPRHTRLKPEPFNPARATGIAIHHTAAETTWRGVAQYHVWGVDPKRNKAEWPVIAYCVGVQAGKVYLLRNIEEMGYHVWGRNEDLLALCVMGDLTKRDPSPADVLAVGRVIRVYDKLMKRQLPTRGHQGWALPGHNTTCPGPLLQRLTPTIRQYLADAEGPFLPALPPRETLLQEAERRLVLQFNPGAALQKRMIADGFVPNSTEFAIEYGGKPFLAQRAERLADGVVRVYHCLVGVWDEVYYVERNAA